MKYTAKLKFLCDNFKVLKEVKDPVKIWVCHITWGVPRWQGISRLPQVPSYTLLPRRLFKINLSLSKILADEKICSIGIHKYTKFVLLWYKLLKFREEMLTTSVVLWYILKKRKFYDSFLARTARVVLTVVYILIWRWKEKQGKTVQRAIVPRFIMKMKRR